MALTASRNTALPAPTIEPFHPNSWSASVPGARSAATEEQLLTRRTDNVFRRAPGFGGTNDDLLRAAYEDHAADDLEIANAGRAVGIRGLNRAEQA